MFVRRRVTVGVTALILVFAVYSLAIATAPLPPLSPSLSVEAETEFAADGAPAQAAADAQAGPTAVGWLHEDQVWANDDGAYRIASLTKMITALVGLEAVPVEAGSDGPVYTVTAADDEVLAEIIADGGTFAPAPAGLELTTRQMLELILVPSANNYATSYARWIFGSDDAYLAAANDWLARHGFDSVQIHDASGMNDDNRANAADMLRISKLVLEDPLLAQIVAASVINIPELGEITTTNRLLGDPGVIGVKTGTVFPEAYNLAVAQRGSESGRDLVALTVVLERPSADARAEDGRAVLASLAIAWQTMPLVEAGEEIGTVTTWTGAEVALVSDASATAVLVPGEAAIRTNSLSPLSAGPAGSVAGTVRISAPGGEQEVSVMTAAAIPEPGFWWKFSHPGALFG